jgi:hypothetical protein
MPSFEKAGFLAGELCPQRLHVKPHGHSEKSERDLNNKKLRKRKNK